VNDLKPFAPSLDWGDALVDSLMWIATAWSIAAVCTLVVLVVIARFTTWGRQFWDVTGAYFTGRQSVKPWLSLAALLLSVIVGVRLAVLLLSEQRPVHGSDDRRARHRHGQSGGERLWRQRLLVLTDDLLGVGGDSRHPRNGGPVPGGRRCCALELMRQAA
jgi:hypothetical protein